MNDKLKEIYDSSIDFWNKAQIYSEEELKDCEKDDWKNIGSESLFSLINKSVEGFNRDAKVLDYGCGTGWLDVILSKNDFTNVKSVDVACNAVESAKLYSKAFECDSLIDYEVVDVDWISNQDEKYYDYAFCINVLDVVPNEVSKSIIENVAKVCKPGACVIFAMNPYFTEAMRNREGCEYDDPYFYVNGILRVNNHTDAEWQAMLSKYFEIEALEHFKWDGEQADRRRFFILKVK